MTELPGRKALSAHTTPFLPCDTSYEAGTHHNSWRDGLPHRRLRVAAPNEKGGVVRRPFSMLRAWLIAVSPQPGVDVAIGTRLETLECPTESAGRERGSRQAPAHRSRQAPPRRNRCFTRHCSHAGGRRFAARRE